MNEEIRSVALHDTARRRYLTYALSVIQSRALPDVRDGLKPVQRRILYTMHHDLHLAASRPPRKCAAVVGEVLGHYHPHGDQAVYEALVRMAQPFAMRAPLVEGVGNFGSLDGDPPAAYRYTECRLTALAEELLRELPQETVEHRPTFDGQSEEPVVLPARIPNLLVNGATGIAVGMATSIPPHNLGEVIKACTTLIDAPSATLAQLLRIIKGPDFPTGGEMLETREDLRALYETGTGSIRLQGQYKLEKGARDGGSIIITSVPYQANKSSIVAEIGRLVIERKMPLVTDVRDESTDDVRIVVELKRGADPELVMAFLYRHTALRTRFPVNLTVLVPGGEGEALVPARIGLKEMLEHFLAFRRQVVKLRLEHDLRLLQERIHILEGFRKIFNHLDEAIAIIRKSDGKEDAAAKLAQRFSLDARQVEAILETKLYRLARLEIKKILDELAEKRREAERLERILRSSRSLWRLVRDELEEVARTYAQPRRTQLGAAADAEPEFNAEDFIEDEDAHVVVSLDGWVKRVGRVGDVAKIRLRQGDKLLGIIAGNTKAVAVFFSNFGSAYSIRINDIPPSRGFGDPIQRLCRFRDGERIIAAVSLDARITPAIAAPKGNGDEPPRHAVAVNTSGYGLRFSLEPFAEVSTKAGRKFARVREGEEIAGVEVIDGSEILCCATRGGKALLCNVRDINFLSGPGRGVKVIGVAPGDRMLGFATTTHKHKGLVVLSAGGRALQITPARYRVTGRGGRGFALTKRSGLTGVVAPEPEAPAVGGKNGNGNGNGRHAAEPRNADAGDAAEAPQDRE